MGFVKKDQITDLTNLKNLIKLSGMTHKQIAEDCGISIPSISAILYRRYQPSVRVIWKLADYFNVPIDYLVGRVSEEEKELVEKDYYLYFKERRKYSYEFNKSHYDKRPSGFYPKSIPPGYYAPWPYNIVNDILNEEITWIITEDQENGLIHAIEQLNTRMQQILYEYYKDNMTLEEIGKKHNLTKERIHQIVTRAIRILRSPRLMKYIKDGLNGSSELREEEIYISERKKQILEMRKELAIEEAKKNIPLENYEAVAFDRILDEFDMSVRLFNCLKRSNYHSMSDVIQAMNDGSIFKIRNLGRKTYDELSKLLISNGVNYNAETQMWSI